MKTAPPISDFGGPLSYKRKLAPTLLALALLPMNLSAWTNGELLIWMDNDRAKGLAPIAQNSRTISDLKSPLIRRKKSLRPFQWRRKPVKAPTSWCGRMTKWVNGRTQG